MSSLWSGVLEVVVCLAGCSCLAEYQSCACLLVALCTSKHTYYSSCSSSCPCVWAEGRARLSQAGGCYALARVSSIVLAELRLT